MAEVRRSASGEPPINFLAHQTRAGLAGASEDFEQMLALLVQAVEGDGRLVFANPGDWGIDVLVGEMSGDVTIWQAKYYVPGVAKKHQGKIESSFESALRRAGEHGYRVKRWVLCVPSSLDPSVTKWWDSWRQLQQAAHDMVIELWDETRLRALLSRPAVAQVRHLYYNPYRSNHGQPDPEPPAAPLSGTETDASAAAPWRGGDERRFGADSYLLHDDAAERHSQDRCWVWREATAHPIGAGPKQVRLRQLSVTRPGSDAAERRAAVGSQAALLRALSGANGLPRLVAAYQDDDSVTVVTTRPPGRTWCEVFGPGQAPMDPVTAAAALVAAAGLSDLLSRLHARRLSHRSLSPDAVLLDHRTGAARLRDIGLAGIPPWAGEGPEMYRAPEQIRPTGPAGPPGPPTDAYQIAAIVYHSVTGHPASSSGSPPISAALPGFPNDLDNLIRRVLETGARQRPADLGRFAATLRRARAQLSQGGAR